MKRKSTCCLREDGIISHPTFEISIENEMLKSIEKPFSIQDEIEGEYFNWNLPNQEYEHIILNTVISEDFSPVAYRPAKYFSDLDHVDLVAKYSQDLKLLQTYCQSQQHQFICTLNFDWNIWIENSLEKSNAN